MKKSFEKLLVDMNACSEAVDWVGSKSLPTAWKTCSRGDWMLWLAASVQLDIQVITSVKVQCASLALHLMKDERSIESLNIAKKFAVGEATREELDTASAAAYAVVAKSEPQAYAAHVAAMASDVNAVAADVVTFTISAVTGDSSNYTNVYIYSIAAIVAAAAAIYVPSTTDAYLCTVAAAIYVAAAVYAAHTIGDANSYSIRKEVLQKSADICRQEITVEMIKKHIGT